MLWSIWCHDSWRRRDCAQDCQHCRCEQNRPSVTNHSSSSSFIFGIPPWLHWNYEIAFKSRWNSSVTTCECKLQWNLQDSGQSCQTILKTAFGGETWRKVRSLIMKLAPLASKPEWMVRPTSLIKSTNGMTYLTSLILPYRDRKLPVLPGCNNKVTVYLGF